VFGESQSHTNSFPFSLKTDKVTHMTPGLFVLKEVQEKKEDRQTEERKGKDKEKSRKSKGKFFFFFFS